MLAATYNRAPSGDIIGVMGDLNAKIGADRTTLEHVLGNQGIGIRNDNGERFVDFCNTNHLFIGGTVFQHKPCHKISWDSPNGRDQIKLITSPSRDILEVVYKTYATRGAHDHDFMIATLRLRTAVAKKCDEEARRAPTYFTDRLKCPTFLINLSKKIVHHATCLATPQSVSLAQKRVAVKTM